MDNDERLNVADALLAAVKLEQQMLPLRDLQQNIEAMILRAQESQEDNSAARIEEGIAHATINKRKLKELESQRQTHLDFLLKYQEFSCAFLKGSSTDEQQSILIWHNNLMSFWDNLNLEGKNDVRSHEIRLRSLAASIEDLSSFIYEDSALASGQWQKPLFVALQKNLQLTRELKNAHKHNDVDIETGSDIRSSLELRLARVGDRVNEVQKSHSACYEEVAKVKKTMIDLTTKSPTMASGCTMAVVAKLNFEHTLGDFLGKNMKNFDDAMDKFSNFQIQKIKAATNLRQFDDLVKQLFNRSSDIAMEY